MVPLQTNKSSPTGPALMESAALLPSSKSFNSFVRRRKAIFNLFVSVDVRERRRWVSC